MLLRHVRAWNQVRFSWIFSFAVREKSIDSSAAGRPFRFRMTKQTTRSLGSVSRSTWFATLAALVAVVSLFTGISLSVISFNHNNLMAYSCSNHAISELGFPYASPMTWVFNGAVAVGGLMFLPMLYVLGMNLRMRSGYVGVGFGFATFLALSGLGMFGLEQDFLHSQYVFIRYFRIHMALSGVFFLGWLATIAAFTIAFCGRWKESISRVMAIVGIISCLVFPTAMIVSIYSHPMETALQKDLTDPAFRARLAAPTSSPILSPWLDSHRPHFWWQAFMEWCLAWSGFLWFGTALVFLWTRPKEGVEFTPPTGCPA